MSNFESFEMRAWVDESKCLTVPIAVHGVPTRRQPSTRRIFGLAATVAFAFVTTLTVQPSAMAQAQSSFAAPTSQSAVLVIDHDLIAGSPAEFWSRAIAQVQEWEPSGPDTIEEPPNVF